MFGHRTKDLIKDQLPKKRDHVVLCPLTTLQVDVYKRVHPLFPTRAMRRLTPRRRQLLQLKDVQDILHADDPCPCMQHQDSHGRPYKLGKCCRQDWTELIFKVRPSSPLFCPRKLIPEPFEQYISLFQKVSNHLALLYPDKEDTPVKYEQDLAYMKEAFPLDHHTRRHGAINIEPDLCGKWNVRSMTLLPALVDP